MPCVPSLPCPRPRSASERAMSARPVSGCPVGRPLWPHGVSSWSASVRRAATARRAGSVRPGRSANGSGGCPSQSRRRCAGAGRAGQRRRLAGRGRRRGGARAAGRVRSPGRPGTAGCAGSPVGLGAGVRADPRPAHVVRGRVGAMRPTMTWAGRRRPRVGLGWWTGPGGRPLRQGPWLDGCGGRAAPPRPKRPGSATGLGAPAL
jgi:hypothetical protein